MQQLRLLLALAAEAHLTTASLVVACVRGARDFFVLVHARDPDLDVQGGNAHFLRGVSWELQERGHEVCIFEPQDAWSCVQLVKDQGASAIDGFHQAYPGLFSRLYGPQLDLDEVLDGADVVLVHEWNDPELVRRIGRHRARGGRYRLFFHDTHHRAVSAPKEIARFDLSNYDAVLAFGEVLRDTYERRGWARRAWVWHEAADTRVFRPVAVAEETGDLVWIGNWGDGERNEELRQYLLEPIRALKLRATIHGVRYGAEARAAVAAAGADYRGWVANYEVPSVFSRYRVTVHVPRRFYAQTLLGIPTIRPFEAMACGIPLITSPWSDTEGLFREGTDYLLARDTQQMIDAVRTVLHDQSAANELARNGRSTIVMRHTCAHRADELLAFYARLEPSAAQMNPKHAPFVSPG